MITILAALMLFLAATLLGESIPGPLSCALYALGGILLGLGVTSAILHRSAKNLSPEEQQDLDRAQTDERNIAIREKAALDSWYWTLYLLWAIFLAIQIFVGGLWGAAISVLIVLHCGFYLVNIRRWSKKM